MKFIDIPSLKPPPGHLTVWRARAPHLSEADWRADPRRASHVQEAHIAYALKTAGEGPLPPSWLGCAFDLPAAFDADAFAMALREWTNHHEILRSHLTLPCRAKPGGQLQRVTLPAGAVSIHPGEVEYFTDGHALAQYLENLFDREVGPLDWPGYVCVTVRRPDATTVYLSADHILIDGYSLLHAVYEIRTLYTTALAALAVPDDKPVSPPLPSAASYLDFAEDERTAADALTSDHTAIVRWRQFLTGGGGRLPAFPVPVGDASGRPSTQPGEYVELLDAAGVRDFDRICRVAGGDAFSGLLACLARIGHELTASDEFRTMVPFNTQTGPWRATIGWYVGMGPVAFPSSTADSFADAVRAAVAGLDGVKDMARIPMTRVAELLGRPLHDPFMVSYMDVRRMRGSRDWNAWRVVGLRSRCTDPDEVCLWFMRTHDGLSVSYRHPASSPAGIAVPRYVARAKHLLSSVASTTGWPAPHPADIQPETTSSD